jgi:hypothetical protein
VRAPESGKDVGVRRDGDGECAGVRQRGECDGHVPVQRIKRDHLGDGRAEEGNRRAGAAEVGDESGDQMAEAPLVLVLCRWVISAIRPTRSSGIGPARDRHRNDDIVDALAAQSQERIERTAHSGQNHVIHRSPAATAGRADLDQVGPGNAEVAPGSHLAIQRAARCPGGRSGAGVRSKQRAAGPAQPEGSGERGACPRPRPGPDRARMVSAAGNPWLEDCPRRRPGRPGPPGRPSRPPVRDGTQRSGRTHPRPVR